MCRRPPTCCVLTWQKKRGGSGLLLFLGGYQSDHGCSTFIAVDVVVQSLSRLQPHGLLHARLFCPSPSPRVYSNSCSPSWWCHPTMSSSVVPFSSCPQSFSASESFPVSQLFVSGGQGIGASASVLPMNIQGWFPFRINWFDLLAVRGTLKYSLTPQFESISSSTLSQPSLWSNSHIHRWLLEKS